MRLEIAPARGQDGMRSNPLASRLLLWTLKRRFRRFHRLVCVLLGSDFACTKFGEGLYLPHPYGIVVHSGVRIGDRCRIYQNASIAAHNHRPGLAIIGDDVFIGAGAAILGPVHIGNGAMIGANTVVLSDVPPGAVAVGMLARVIPGDEPATEMPDPG